MALRPPLSPAASPVPHAPRIDVDDDGDGWFLEDAATTQTDPAKPRFEMHGAAYIAYCRPWGPRFVAPDAEDESAAASAGTFVSTPAPSEGW
jgi:hypothetical protein